MAEVKEKAGQNRNYYALPEDVKFCKRCVTSNQSATSVPEYKHTKNRKKPTVAFDEEGICSGCRYMEVKEKIEWKKREKELTILLDRYRRHDGYYDKQ